MALTLEDLKRLFSTEGVNYFVAPDKPAVLATFRGFETAHQVVALLEVEGTFLQFRTLGWLHCPVDHPAVTEVLKVAGEENYRRRMVKIGWDPADGELVAYADVWIEDGTLTQAQFSRMLYIYLPVMEMAYARLRETIETGHDPGERSIEDLIAKHGKPEGGPPSAPEDVYV